MAAGKAPLALAAACLGQVMVEAYRRDAASKDQLISELKATKKRLDSEVKELRRGLMQLQGDKASAEAERSRLQKEVSQVKQQMAALEGHLESVQRERDELETHLQVWGHAAAEVQPELPGGFLWGMRAWAGLPQTSRSKALLDGVSRQERARVQGMAWSPRRATRCVRRALSFKYGGSHRRTQSGDGLMCTWDSPLVMELGAWWQGGVGSASPQPSALSPLRGIS